MKIILGILAAVSLTTCSVEKWTDVRVKYGTSSTGIDTKAFFEVEKTLARALAGNWTSINVTNFLNLRAVGYKGDYAFTPLYDVNGYLAGAQIASSVNVIDAVGPSTFDPTEPGTNEIITMNGTEYYASTFLFADPATLKCGERTGRGRGRGRGGRGGRGLEDGVVGNGLWVRNTSESSGFTRIPDDLDQVLNKTLYTWQNCIPNMGTHYFYNMSTAFDCNQLFSWFLLGQNGSVSGIGYQLFGNPLKLNQNRFWYDNVNIRSVAAELTVPNGSNCLYNWTDTYGIVSIHVYFTPEPWNITCDQEDDSVSPITNTTELTLSFG